MVSPYRKQSVLLLALGSILAFWVTWLVSVNIRRNQLDIFDGKQRKLTLASPDDLLHQGCDAFIGKWVWDNTSRPLYEEWDCPHLHRFTACRSSGRPDSLYQNWRWQTNGCNMPTFDPLKLLNVLRGKRLMFVGDSVQRNQFESMVCMVQSAIPEEKKAFWKLPPSMIKFKAEELNVSIEFYWAPFLVDSNADDAENHSMRDKVVHMDSIDRHGESWKEADILVFDTHAWWFAPSITYLYKGERKEYTAAQAYKRGLTTWTNWLDKNINPRKQQIFFMTMSPTHWGASTTPGSDGNCFNETYPNFNLKWGTDTNFHSMEIVKDAVRDAIIKVTLLNITQLSQYRVDAHTSYYGKYRGMPITEAQKEHYKRFGDCLHWCLPGVPDTWNEILYAYLLRNHQTLLSE